MLISCFVTRSGNAYLKAWEQTGAGCWCCRALSVPCQCSSSCHPMRTWAEQKYSLLCREKASYQHKDDPCWLLPVISAVLGFDCWSEVVYLSSSEETGLCGLLPQAWSACRAGKQAGQSPEVAVTRGKKWGRWVAALIQTRCSYVPFWILRLKSEVSRPRAAIHTWTGALWLAPSFRLFKVLSILKETPLKCFNCELLSWINS